MDTEVGVNAAVAAGGGSNEQSPVSEATAAGEPIVSDSPPTGSPSSGSVTASDGETTAVADGNDAPGTDCKKAGEEVSFLTSALAGAQTSANAESVAAPATDGIDADDNGPSRW